MSKTNILIKYLNNISKSINSLLEKNLNKLNFNNLRNITKNNKIILIFVALFVLFLLYLLLPTFYNKSDASKELKNKLSDKLALDFKFSDDLNYNIFPRPHFIIRETRIMNNNEEITKNGEIKINVSLKNFFNLKNIEIRDVILENANFHFNKENYNFFVKLLNNRFKNGSLEIRNSNVFFESIERDVLFLNKILKMKYYYDTNELKNILEAENEIFNIPYEIKLFDNQIEKKLITKLNFNFIKLQLENELDYAKDIKSGKSNVTFKKLKSSLIYELNNYLFTYNFFDKVENPKFIYKGKFNFKPFYSSFTGKTKELNLSNLFGTNAFIAQLIKTEIFNNENIDFKLNIDAEKIQKNINFKNINIKSKIQEGLIDIDNTSFEWKNFAEFRLTESLIYVKDGELVLDGKLRIFIKNYNEIYSYLLTPKKYRNKIETIDLNFSYNFDQKIADLSDIRIDKKIIQKLNIVLNKLMFKTDSLQNKIYLKNLLNEAIKIY